MPPMLAVSTTLEWNEPGTMREVGVAIVLVGVTAPAVNDIHYPATPTP